MVTHCGEAFLIADEVAGPHSSADFLKTLRGGVDSFAPPFTFAGLPLSAKEFLRSCEYSQRGYKSGVAPRNEVNCLDGWR